MFSLLTPSPLADLALRSNARQAPRIAALQFYFGPTAPAGKEGNWVQTWPGKGWNVILRLYGPLQTWFDQTWRPGEIDEMK